ncbi:MAG: hypothetical protein RJA57_1459 [Bacteroidota bacterium]|jgi:hypothetical protein
MIVPFLMLSSVLLLQSCRPSRVWANKERVNPNKERRTVTPNAPHPASYTPVVLVLRPNPGFIMKQNAAGRFYHRSASGHLYWKGYDNRFFIDASHLPGLRYTRWEYDEWKRYREASR